MGHQPRIMVIFGTRPEAIKMAPIVRELRDHNDDLGLCTVVTAQHRSMLDQVLETFQIVPDHDLDIMLPGQTLSDITCRALTGLDGLMRRESPDLVLVQGDTTTAFVGGLAAFYHRIPVGHVEAGLRTRDKYNPYPEEVNRQFLGVLADLCFAPTMTAREALLAESVPDSRIIVTGNTVIDALLSIVERAHQFTVPSLQSIDFRPPIRTLLVTAHRRENLGVPLEDVCYGLRDLLVAREDLQVVFPVHLNPKVGRTVRAILGNHERAKLVEALDYLDFVHVMKHAEIVITDSGGVQEEAPALGIPVLVIRATTERPEAVKAGTARLVGTSRKDLVAVATQLLDDPSEYARMQRAINPYGDGYAAQRIVHAIRHFFGLSATRPAPFEACA